MFYNSKSLFLHFGNSVLWIFPKLICMLNVPTVSFFLSFSFAIFLKTKMMLVNWWGIISLMEFLLFYFVFTFCHKTKYLQVFSPYLGCSMMLFCNYILKDLAAFLQLNLLQNSIKNDDSSLLFGFTSHKKVNHRSNLLCNYFLINIFYKLLLWLPHIFQFYALFWF